MMQSKYPLQPTASANYVFLHVMSKGNPAATPLGPPSPFPGT